MRPFHYIIAILGSAVIMGCGGASREAKSAANEQPDYDWSGYKGTYAPGSPATKGQSETPPEPKKESAETKTAQKSEQKSESKPAEAKTEAKSDDAKSMYSEDDDSKPSSDDPPKKKKKKKKGGVAGGSKPSAGTPKKAPRKRSKKS